MTVTHLQAKTGVAVRYQDREGLLHAPGQGAMGTGRVIGRTGSRAGANAVCGSGAGSGGQCTPS